MGAKKPTGPNQDNQNRPSVPAGGESIPRIKVTIAAIVRQLDLHQHL